MTESNHDLPLQENPRGIHQVSKRRVTHTSMLAHQNAATDFAPRTRARVSGAHSVALPVRQAKALSAGGSGAKG